MEEVKEELGKLLNDDTITPFFKMCYIYKSKAIRFRLINFLEFQ